MKKPLRTLEVGEVINQAYFEVLCEQVGITDIEGYKKKLAKKPKGKGRRLSQSISVKAMCKKVGISRSGYYKSRKAKRLRSMEESKILEFARSIRQLHPYTWDVVKYTPK